MNERWIEVSCRIAAYYRQPNFRVLERLEYLYVTGLFETGWIVHAYQASSDNFGYPR